MRFKTRLTVESGKLDSAPLVDVVFLLLLFFMLSSSFVFQPGIKVDLPVSSVSEQVKQEKIVVTITKEDIIFVNDIRTTLEGMKRRIQKEAARNSSMHLILKADNNVRHGKVVRIMSVAREAGIQSISIATRAERP